MITSIKLEKYVWNIKVATSAASVQIFPLNIRVSTYNLNKINKIHAKLILIFNYIRFIFKNLKYRPCGTLNMLDASFLC